MFNKLKASGFPLNMKVSFKHPIFGDDGIFIFIDSDMPHLIKKFVNALERSGQAEHKTDLQCNGQKLSLAMLHHLWIQSGSGSGSSIRTVQKFTKDHFKKNSYSRMRVHLAMQITSTTCANMIDDYSPDCGGKDNYKPLKESI